MNGNERADYAVRLAGKIMDAMDDLECLWAYHGLPGAPKNKYRSWPEPLVRVARLSVLNWDNSDLMQAIRICAAELYQRFDLSKPE